MKGIENVSLVKELSSPAIYLIVGNVKFWIVDPVEFQTLGFDWSKVRVVDDGALGGFTQKLLHAPLPGLRPSDVFFDCCVFGACDDYDALQGRYLLNCKKSSSIVRKDVLLAGWLVDTPEVNVPHGEGTGIEDIHYYLHLDTVFLDRMYGSHGLSIALADVVWPGNPPAPNPIPLAFPSGEPGSHKGVPFYSWILPYNDHGYDLECELNAWHTNDKGKIFSYHWKGRGSQPPGWVNPLSTKDDDAWFPFNPLDPEVTGHPLQPGDYLVLRGTIWQDFGHDDQTPSSSDPWRGWSEMHPPDWIVQIDSPGPNARMTTGWLQLYALGLGRTVAGDLTVRPDFAPSSPNKLLHVRTWQGLIDFHFSTGLVDSFQLTESSDSISLHLVIRSRKDSIFGNSFKIHLLVGWSETDRNDVVWVDDQLPPGATPDGGGEGWDWATAYDLSREQYPFMGQRVHRSALANGVHQHSFQGATTPMQVGPNDTLFAMVYLDPDNPPEEVMLQWHTSGGWLSRAYWGENLIGYGADGTSQRRYIGPLPRTGEWVRLEVPANMVGFGGIIYRIPVDGMAFTLWSGKANWDYTGVRIDPSWGVSATGGSGSYPGSGHGYNPHLPHPKPRPLPYYPNNLVRFHNQLYNFMPREVATETETNRYVDLQLRTSLEMSSISPGASDLQETYEGKWIFCFMRSILQFFVQPLKREKDVTRRKRKRG